MTVDAKRALALLERVQQRVATNDEGNGVASQVQADLDLLTSLLQNPVLRNILKLEDSLEELNQHLVHHPSLLPSDFDIDKTGTLVVNQNILQTHRRISSKTKGGKSSPALSNASSSKQSTVSPETHKREVDKTAAEFQQSILQAAAKREIIAIQVKTRYTKRTFSCILTSRSPIRQLKSLLKVRVPPLRALCRGVARKYSYKIAMHVISFLAVS